MSLLDDIGDAIAASIRIVVLGITLICILVIVVVAISAISSIPH